MACVIIQVGSLSPETYYDAAEKYFIQLISLSEELCSSITATSTDNTSFSLDLGFLAPTLYATIRCRQPQLRRRAIRVLERCPRREGVWNSTAAAAIAHRWMSLEEKGLGVIDRAEEVPKSKRIAGVRPHIILESATAELRFFNAASLTDAKIVDRSESLEWSH